jgi:hypothetical protein
MEISEKQGFPKSFDKGNAAEFEGTLLQQVT